MATPQDDEQTIEDEEQGLEMDSEAPGSDDGEESTGEDSGESAEAADGDEGQDGESSDESSDGDDADADGEVLVSIEGESSVEDTGKAPDWVRDLRKQNRDLVRRTRELEAQVASSRQPASEVAVGEKPTLESCGFDADKFAEDLDAWHDRRRQADARQAERKADEDRAKAAWQERMNAYGAAKSKLRVTDFEDAEGMALDALTVVQQGIVINAMDNPALVMYAIGKNPRKAKELAAISDPVRFTAAVAKLEAALKVTPKTKAAAPTPERKLGMNTGGAGANLATKSRLEALHKEAQRTGDYTRYFAAKNAKK